jgi:uncharacterized membrane protein
MWMRMMSEHHKRFYIPHMHLSSVFGDDWFAKKAEAFARFFGTSTFLITQTVIVFFWIFLNVVGVLHFDLYPFILLNLAFSLQAAYAAPLILLAQTRQADRDKASTEADAAHREEIAMQQRLQGEQMMELLSKNTELTASVKALSEQIASLTKDMHQAMTATASATRS